MKSTLRKLSFSLTTQLNRVGNLGNLCQCMERHRRYTRQRLFQVILTNPSRKIRIGCRRETEHGPHRIVNQARRLWDRFLFRLRLRFIEESPTYKERHSIRQPSPSNPQPRLDARQVVPELSANDLSSSQSTSQNLDRKEAILCRVTICQARILT